MRIVLGILGASLWGCNGGGNTNPAAGRDKTMVLHLMDDPQGLNPANTVGASAALLHNLLFDHLIALDFKTLGLVPHLAEGLPALGEDGKTLAFTLKKDLKFADGHPMRAQDVVFSFKALMNPFVDSAPRRSELHNFGDCIALDERRVHFRMEDSGPMSLNRLAINFFVMPAHIYDPQNLSQGFTARQAVLAERAPDSVPQGVLEAMRIFAEHFEAEKFQREKGSVVGSGRYLLDEWETGQRIRLVKNPHYWNADSPSPAATRHMDTLIFRTISDVQTAFQALKSGEIDFSDAFEAEQYEELMKGASFDTYFAKQSVSYPFYEYIGWNTNIRNQPRRQLFSDPKVRMALSHLTDVDGMIEQILYGTATRINSLIWHQRPEYNKDLRAIPYDEAKAKQMLAEAGWKDSDGDGVLDKDIAGENVKFEFNLSYKRGNELRRRIALHVQESYRKAGIMVNVQDMDWAVMLQKLKDHELDAWIGAWVYDSDEQDLYSLYHSSQILNEGYNWTSYSNPKADALMESISKEWDQEKRFAMHREIQAVLYADQPYTLLFANSTRIAYNKRLRTDAWYGQRPCYDVGQFYVVEARN